MYSKWYQVIHSSDLAQGGLEVPCILTFKATQAAEKDKAKKLNKGSLSSGIKIELTSLGSSNASLLYDKTSNSFSLKSSASNNDPGIHATDDNNDDGGNSKPLVKKQKLSKLEIENTVMGVELSDMQIILAHRVLKLHFPELNGLESTLYQNKQQFL